MPGPRFDRLLHQRRNGWGLWLPVHLSTRRHHLQDQWWRDGARNVPSEQQWLHGISIADYAGRDGDAPHHHRHQLYYAPGPHRHIHACAEFGAWLMVKWPDWGACPHPKKKLKKTQKKIKKKPKKTQISHFLYFMKHV